MLQQERIECVIMLCNIIENGKARCFDYLNNREVEEIQTVEDYMEVSKVKVLSENEDDHWYYTHIHYSEWPDRGLPENPEHLRRVIEEATKFERIVIHCSAGLGRSGVLTAALIL
jgi:protein tyrosine phosphatase